MKKLEKILSEKILFENFDKRWSPVKFYVDLRIIGYSKARAKALARTYQATVYNLIIHNEKEKRNKN